MRALLPKGSVQADRRTSSPSPFSSRPTKGDLANDRHHPAGADSYLALAMTLAILCSGQGRQHRQMFALTGDVPEAAGLFAHAAALLGGKDPREIVRTETSEALHNNRIGQILCGLQALAAAAALRNTVPGRRVVAGYSI